MKKKENHVKPTKKELEEDIKKTQEELEALKDKPEPTPSPSGPPELSPSPSPFPEATPEEPPSPSPSPEVDYKEKFVASSREAQILHAKNKKINEALEKAGQVPEPTDEEMMAEYSDWEVMSEFEKKMARQTLIANRRFAALADITKEFKDSEGWQKKIDDFLADPQTLVKHPELEGQEDDFRLFATKPTRRGVDFEDLIPAFLYNLKTTMPEKKKGKMFEIGTGGPVKPPKNVGKLSIEEAAQLRKTDYKKYKAYLLAGKIASTEI